PALNYYRDGRDSVAWHADRELRVLDDTLIAIVTLGVRRPFLLRPKGGGRSVDVAPGSGDLLVMGGAAQRDWEHAVPKTARSGPRVSVSFRWPPAPSGWNAGMARNVLGTELVPCSLDPVTGFYRNGCCDTGAEDVGVHAVCAVMTAEFLDFSRRAGNDLSTPM